MINKYIFDKSPNRWWRGASVLGHVKSQEELELANNELSKAFDYKLPFNSRKIVHKTRFALLNLLWKCHFGKNLILVFNILFLQ
jgi:hypothetical protein